MKSILSPILLLLSLSFLVGAASASTLTIEQGIVPAIGNTASVNMTLDEVPTGLAGYSINLTIDNPGVAMVTAVSYPSWATLTETSALPSDECKLKASDVGESIPLGATNLTLATVTLKGLAGGSTTVNLTVNMMNDDNDTRLFPVVMAGNFTVDVPIEVPVAIFTANVTTGYTPLMVAFTDQSSNAPTSWTWDFNNDGTTDATSRKPVYTFTTPGNYTVNLTATNSAGSDSEVKTNYIVVNEVPPDPPVANFARNVSSGEVPLSVLFTDTSTGGAASSWAWDFQDDGTIDSHEKNPVFVYTAAGTYSVNLTVANAGGSSSRLKADCITTTDTHTTPVAAFTASPTTGTAPLSVQFGDLSTLGTPTSWNWSFGDTEWWNTTDKTQKNRAHTYTTAGVYTATLTVSNAGGSNTTLPGTVITVTGEPAASFTFSPTAGYAPLFVQCNDTSTCDPLTTITGWNWSFDGGTTWTNLTDPAERNVTHTFGTAGTYLVILEVTDGNGGTSRTTSPVSVLGPTFSVLGITPSKGTIGTSVSATITGTNFTPAPAMSVDLTRGPEVIAATSVKVTGNKKISCKFMIPLTAPGGTWNLTVRKPGGESVGKPDAFTINTLPAPKVSSVSPSSGYRNGTMAFALSGSNFIPGSVVTFTNADHAVTALLDPITKTTKITGNLTTNATSLLGKWNISVVLPDGRSGGKTNAFQLNPYTTPVISSMTPTSGYPNMTYTFSVNGNLFQDPGTIAVLTRGTPGESIPLTLTGITLKKLTGTVYIPSDTATAKWNLSVTTADGGTVVKKGVFTVKPWPAPRVASMTPTTVTHGTTVSYTLAGSNLQPGSTVTLTNSSAPGLNFTASVNKLTQTRITGTFDVPAIAAGKYGIEVTCPDGKVATKKNALTIK